MRTLSTLAILAAVATVLGAPGRLAAQGPDEVATGAKVYGSTCGRCHNARSPLERTDREWVTITNHMRVRANLTGSQLRSVLAFLQATNTDPREATALPGPGAVAVPSPEMAAPPSTDPATITTGRNLVEAKACVGCHVIGRTGGNLGPGLNGVVGRRGAAFVRQKLADPTVGNATSMMPNFGLSPAEIEAITAYLASLGR